MPEEKRTECWWLILRDGTAVDGDHGGGVLLLTELKLTRPIGRILGLLRLSSTIDVCDRVLSRYRKRLSRFVPDGPSPQRFP